MITALGLAWCAGFVAGCVVGGAVMYVLLTHPDLLTGEPYVGPTSESADRALRRQTARRERRNGSWT